MNNSNRISARVLLAVASLAFSPAAWSLGLGDVTVESYLNQPLRARIDLISSERDDLSTVTAKLASAADYELIGASLEDLSVPVRFAVEQEGGDAYIVASSNVPVNNPILRLIVEVNWANGRMLREYTLFLDPPLVPEAAPETAPLPRIDLRESAPVAPPAAETAPAATPEPAATRAPSEPRAQRVPQTGEYGPVASGETLWGIASNWSSGTGLDVNRVMIAIQRNNPDAFLNDNINLLKRGAILRMPEVSEVERISTSVAYSEVEQQEAEFTGQRAAAPVTSPSMPLLAEEAALDLGAKPAKIFFVVTLPIIAPLFNAGANTPPVPPVPVVIAVCQGLRNATISISHIGRVACSASLTGVYDCSISWGRNRIRIPAIRPLLRWWAAPKA